MVSKPKGDGVHRYARGGNRKLRARMKKLRGKSNDSELPSTCVTPEILQNPPNCDQVLNVPNESIPKGGRLIVSVQILERMASVFAQHGKNCDFNNFKVIESKKMCWREIRYKCDCGKELKFPLDSEENTLPFVESLLTGMYASGSTFEAIETILTTLEIQNLGYWRYKNTTHEIAQKMSDAVKLDLIENGQEEYREALKDGNYIVVDGMIIGIVTVVIDGAWGKRSYKHNYDANCGAAVIIGNKTRKPLYIDTRVKTCAICERDSQRMDSQNDEDIDEPESQPTDHVCFKNWDKSSSSMEASIIVEGFQKSIEMHKLIYRYVIGDGDASTYKEIVTNVKYPNKIYIEKITCKNHAKKCLNTHLYEAARNTAYTKSERDALSPNIDRFGKLAQGAIDYNNKNQPVTNASTLKSDLMNLPYHVFGDHSKCNSVYNCKRDKPNKVPEMKNTRIWVKIIAACNRLADLSERGLIQNQTSNFAESFFSHMNKKLCGKRVNFGQRGQYNIRANAATLEYQNPYWPARAHQLLSGKSANMRWVNRNSFKIRKNQWQNKRKRKPRRLKKSPADPRSYGTQAMTVDKSEAELKSDIEKYIEGLQVTQEQQIEIMNATKNQAHDQRWFLEREGRITASIAGKIYNMRDSTSNKSTIMGLLYPKTFTSPDIERGKVNESVALQKYEELNNVQITKCGLIVSLENGIFGASPDGLVGDDGIVEIKCTKYKPSEIPHTKNKWLRLRDPNDPSSKYFHEKHSLLPMCDTFARDKAKMGRFYLLL